MVNSTQKAARLVNVAGVLDHYGISESTLRRGVADGTIPHLRLGRQLRFDLDVLDAHFEVPATRTLTGALSVTRTQRRPT